MEHLQPFARDNRSSFTLIELLIVLVIIGILATLAIPQYDGIIWRARFAEVNSVVGSLARAKESYFTEAGNYGGNFPAVQCLMGKGYDPNSTQIQKELGISLPNGGYFTYLVYPCAEWPAATNIYFAQPGYCWAWVYNYATKKWYNYSTDPALSSPCKKYFTPPQGST